MKNVSAKISVKSSKNRKEKIATVRGFGVFHNDNQIFLYFKSSEDDASHFHLAKSSDGFSFEKDPSSLTIQKGKFSAETLTNCSQFTITKVNDHYLLLYRKKRDEIITLEKAWSKNLRDWIYEGEMPFPIDSPVTVLPTLIDNSYVAFTTDTTLKMFSSKDLNNWHEEYSSKDHIYLPKTFTILASFKTEKGILLLLNYTVRHVSILYAVLVDPNDPNIFLWMGKEALWSTPSEWKGKKVTSLGTILLGDMIIGYWQLEDEAVYATVYSYYKTTPVLATKNVSLELKRSHKNPLISPESHNSWEAFTTFNPAAIFDDGKVHLLYRAQGHDYISVLGYATSRDGIHIDERLDTPVFVPTQGFEYTPGINNETVTKKFISGGGFGGCEDPRITKIDDRYYLTYVAFDGMNPPRVALTSISREHFLNRRWLWEKPVIISPPGVVDKSAVIFPEKIGGKYVIMHRIYPDILIDFVDTLNFDGTYFLEGKYKISPRENHWDSRKIGAGAPPIKTPYGWLLIYQSVSEQDSGRYKIGAMLLDLNNPYIVLHRTNAPILEPTAHYENEGFKSGVIYPCGAVVIDETLFVYYGGADSYVCVATAHLEEFLRELRFSDLAKLTTPITEKIF